MLSSTQQNIVIVGGGYAGTGVAKILVPKLDSSKYKIVLITSSPFMVHRLAAARAIVTDEGNLEDQALVPYDRLFTSPHSLVVGSVASIHRPAGSQTGGHVTLDDGSTLPFAILVLATGSIWPKALEWPKTRKGVEDRLRETRESVKTAQSVVVAGGGAVGMELVGEIKHYYPHIDVTVVHKGRKLMNDKYRDKFRDLLEAKAQKLGINVILGDALVDDVPRPDGWVTTTNGRRIRADRIIQAVGNRPQTAFIRSLGNDVLAPGSNLVRVLPTLQLPAYPEIFAAGDIIDWDEQKMTFKAMAHSQVVGPNVLALTQGKALKAKYKGSMEGIMVTLGPNGGVLYVPLFWGWCLCLGDWVVRKVKAADLVVPKARQFLGY